MGKTHTHTHTKTKRKTKCGVWCNIYFHTIITKLYCFKNKILIRWKCSDANDSRNTISCSISQIPYQYANTGRSGDRKFFLLKKLQSLNTISQGEKHQIRSHTSKK